MVYVIDSDATVGQLTGFDTTSVWRPRGEIQDGQRL